MYIYGTSQVHAAQPLAAPHRMAPAQATSSPYSASGVDQLDISPQADFVAQARELPDIRQDRVAAIRARAAEVAVEWRPRVAVPRGRRGHPRTASGIMPRSGTMSSRRQGVPRVRLSPAPRGRCPFSAPPRRAIDDA